MPRAKNMMRAAALLAILGAAALGVAHLFALRFERGDVYPPYSTLRADPLGARAYYEALGRLPGLDVQRNLRPLPRLKLDAPAGLFILGLERWIFDEADEASVREAEHVASLGGRVVIAFAPSYQQRQGAGPFGPTFAGPKATPTPVSPFSPPPKDGATTSPLAAIFMPGAAATSATVAAQATPAAGEEPAFMGGRAVSLSERWGVTVRHSPFPGSSDGKMGYVEARLTPDAPRDLPAMLRWHSAITFEPLDVRWRAIYARGVTPVVIERPWGRGSIALISDSYYFSNEAARHDREPALLAWAAGPQVRFIFNETHHGLLQEPGIMGLAHEYQLEGIMIALLALALLFVWRSASSLVPRGADGDAAGGLTARGTASSANLAALLRRHIPHGDILGVCFAEWKQTAGTLAKRRKDNVALMESIVYYEREKPTRERDTAAAYREMTRILNERRVRRDPDPR